MHFRTIIFVLSAFYVAGCHSDYYSKEEFQSALKIDAHVHIDTDRGLIEGQAIKDNFKVVAICVDESDSAFVKEQLGHALTSKKKFPESVFYAATFHFDTSGWETADWSRKVIAHLKENISGGAVSVKFYKNIGMTQRDKNGKFIMIDNSLIKPVIDFLVRNNLPITGHLGEPLNCWLPINEMTIRGDSNYYAKNPQFHMYQHPEFPSHEQQLNARDHLLELHPDLKFIGCHLGSLEWDVDELAKRLDKFPNMAVDMAARISHLEYQTVKDREKVRNFCIKYQDRLLYGTDIGDNGRSVAKEFANTIHEIWFKDWRYFTSDDELTSKHFKGKFQGLRLPKEVVNKIFSLNAIRWYQLPVRN